MNREIANEWLKAAFDDIQTMEEIISNINLTHIVAFHAQQSIEKSIKALLEYNKQPVPKKHDLILLYSLASNFIKIEDEDILDVLNSLYTESRYPGELGLLPNGKPSPESAQKFYIFAKNIYEEITQKLCL